MRQPALRTVDGYAQLDWVTNSRHTVQDVI